MNLQSDYTPSAPYARGSSDRPDVDLPVTAQLRALREAAPGVCSMVRGSRTFAITAMAVLALALVVSSVSVVQAQDAEQTATPAPTAEAGPPLGDCYGGALSQDPLHCYALEQAERRKLIDVTALYAAPGDGPLYVWLKQTGPVSDAVYAFLKTKSYDFYDRWPDQVVDGGGYADVCSGGYRACVLDRISWDEDFMLPSLPTYGYAVFHVGGEKAQRQHVAGASWRQLWPNPAGARDVTSAFDISDVDTTNFPACDDDSGCGFPGYRPGFGMAGYHSISSPTGITAYVQIKDPPEGEADFEAFRNTLREHLWPCGGRVGSCTFVNRHGETAYTQLVTPRELEIVPVKYSYEELWRWAIVLDRFASSAGNTVGVTQARVAVNSRSPRQVTYPLVGLQFAEISYAEDGPKREAHLRETIQVDGLDQDLLVAALPTLLPQLGIPVDAVGMVGRNRRYDGPAIAYLLDGSPSGGAGGLDEPLGQGGSGDGLPVGAIAGAAGLVAVVALGAVVAWRRRA